MASDGFLRLFAAIYTAISKNPRLKFTACKNFRHNALVFRSRFAAACVREFRFSLFFGADR